MIARMQRPGSVTTSLKIGDISRLFQQHPPIPVEPLAIARQIEPLQ